MEKPRMTGHGDIYYQGKEREVRYRKHRPGNLSKRLRNALHMLDGAPPPYLLNMQRFGPPPSYPELRIPGLNAPLPPGAKYGYSEGQWGKPPVDEVFARLTFRLTLQNGYALYGDPFGVRARFDGEEEAGPRPLWGELEKAAAQDEGWEDAEMDDAEPADDEEAAALEPELQQAMRTREAAEEPAQHMAQTQPSRGNADRALYRILDQKKAVTSAKGLLGSAHTYELGRERTAQGEEHVDVALSGLELESLDEMTIKHKFEEGVRKSGESGAAPKRAGRKGRGGDRDIGEFKF